MTDQKLVYRFDGDPSGLKKAMAEVEAANRRMTEALTRKVGDIGAFKGTQESLDKLSAALTEAKRRRDFFMNSAASGGAAGTKLFAQDIARAKAEVLRLAAAMQAQQSRLSGLGQSLKSAGIDTGNLAAAEARLSTSIRSANAVAAAQVSAMQRSSVQGTALKRSLEDMRGAADKLRAAFGPLLATLAAGVSVRGLAQAADGYANLQARLKLAARSQDEFAASNDAIQRIASAAQAPLTETAALYTRIANSLKDTNVSQAAFVDTTEAVALALRLSGASVAESQSAMLQLSQAIASGVLRGEEFNAVSEAAPRLLQALAVSLNKPVAELRAMAKEGQLTREVLINGLAAELPTLRREAESLPRTLSGAFTEMGNRVLLMVGQIDQASGASATLAKSFLELGTPAIRTVFQTLAVLGANVAFVFKTVGREIGAYAAQIAAILRGDFKGARFIRDAVAADAKAARAELDALEKKILGLGATKAITKPVAGKSAAGPGGAGKPDKAALTAARQEAAALLKAQESLEKAQESLEKARADAAAQGLEDSLTARREKLDQARKAELIDEAGFIAAKAALDEEGLRNELAALQAQRDKLRAESTNPAAKGSERTQALAELALVEARILSASDKILNLNVAATAELTALGVANLKSQTDFIKGLEDEARLSGLTNDERETALLLLEAEKLGITDINRLLELQGQIRANANAKAAEAELKRSQDALYDSVQEGVQRAFADGLNAIATGGTSDALKNLVDTLRNALSNALGGSLAQSFLGLFGGKAGVLNIAGSLGLGGKRDGSNPANAVYVQDVGVPVIPGAAGAEGGGLFAGLGNLLSSLFASIKAAFVSMVSSIGNALSGAFGGGGSGQNWIGSIASLFGFAEGGWTGPGGNYQPAGIVHADEFVFDKVATNRIGVGVLENMRRLASGRFVSSRPRLGYADGGAVNLPGAAAPNVRVSLRNINHYDMDEAMSDYLKTRSGERAILNIIQRNPGAVGE
jgi:tape measure domain-containing protein